VEIGSWCGRSAVALGLAARQTGDTRVHCIDLFPRKEDWNRNADGSYSMRVRLGDEAVDAYRVQTVWREPFERDIAPLYQRSDGILDIFEQTISSNALGDVVVSYRGTSKVLARKRADGFRCRLAFIDGDHSFEAVCHDIDNIEPALLPGGWLCFDDAFTSYDGVDRAIRERVIKNCAFDLKQQLTRKLFVARKRP
jgi:predicted O-methyltransferase YrrM